MTAACVKALLEAGTPAATVIVVDNGSSDDSLERLWAFSPDLTVLLVGENLGFARANNLGVRYALAELAPDYLFLLNNDAFVERKTISELVAALQKQPRAGAAAPKILHGDSDRIWYCGGWVDWKRGAGVHRQLGRVDRGQAERPGPTGFASACALLLRRECVAPAGLFDERYFFMGEDVDLSLRLIRAGRPVWYVPTAVVRHQAGASVRQLGSAFLWYHKTRNRLLTVSKHATTTEKIQFYACWPVAWLVKAFTLALRGQPTASYAIYQGIRDFCAGRFTRRGPMEEEHG